ncbi:hypothetical protein AZE42_11743, partial [Rhizopogon vesiculosus]
FFGLKSGGLIIPALSRTLQHKFKGQHRNIKPEIFWSQPRRRWTPGFEDVLDFGLTSGIYNPDDALERLLSFPLCEFSSY